MNPNTNRTKLCVFCQKRPSKTGELFCEVCVKKSLKAKFNKFRHSSYFGKLNGIGNKRERKWQRRGLDING